MGHLLEAIKKLEQNRGAVRPKPVRRAVAEHAAKIWRIDEPHRVGIADRTLEPHFAGSKKQAETSQKADEIQRANAIPSLPDEAATPAIASVPEAGPSAAVSVQSAAGVVWQFAAPAVPSDYDNLAARLVGQLDNSQRPHSVLLTAVSRAALDTVSLAVLAQAISTQGDVLWIDTRRVRPTPDAVWPLPEQKPGWQELREGTATWEEIIAPTSLSGVSFVGCCNRPLVPQSHEFGRQLFDPLRSRFSVVLIDGGLVEEAASLARHCGVIALAAAIGRTTRSEVNGALQTLAAVGCRPLIIAVEPQRP